ncbi:MAG: hypothetical protein K8F92_08665 [Hyphomicrobium sp.]|uniref:hypothetical protein n=1 Tax=Hyphomicrobium sp. TaxID=82 RepID=UPI0025C40055|nr:hypothetical protein [Hyphomicrobium sp.]MBZ0209714.1 hypothetical protein [Hyphomicrobium sp.]
MLKSLITALALVAVAMTGVVGQAQAHHKPGYHDGLPKMPKPLTPLSPRLPRN